MPNAIVMTPSPPPSKPFREIVPTNAAVAVTQGKNEPRAARTPPIRMTTPAQWMMPGDVTGAMAGPTGGLSGTGNLGGPRPRSWPHLAQNRPPAAAAPQFAQNLEMVNRSVKSHPPPAPARSLSFAPSQPPVAWGGRRAQRVYDAPVKRTIGSELGQDNGSRGLRTAEDLRPAFGQAINRPGGTP